MPMDEQEKITPYRMNLMVKKKEKITEMIVNGKYLYKPSFKEIEIVLGLVEKALHESQEVE